MANVAASKPEAADIDPADLGLIDDRLEDEGKDEAELWNEFDEAEGVPPAREDDDADDGDADAGDDASGADDGEDEGADAPPDGKAKERDADPWAGVPDTLRAEFERLQQSDRSNRGRVAAMQKQIAELSAAKPARSGPAGEQAEGDGAGYLQSDEWKSLKDDYPEIAAPLEAVVGSQQAVIAQLKSQTETMTRQLSSIGEERISQAATEQAALLEEAHPQWQSLAAENAFGDWLSKQPRHMREAAERNADRIVDWEEAADVIGRFKQSIGYPGDQTPAQAGADQRMTTAKPALSGRRQRQLQSAQSAQSRAPGTTSGIPRDGDPQAIWDAFEREEARKKA